jgi:hypothetical protein
MTGHMVGTREEWLAARLELLGAEKELTRRGDELARRRRELPWVPVEKDYRFETAVGPASLRDLFRERESRPQEHPGVDLARSRMPSSEKGPRRQSVGSESQGWDQPLPPYTHPHPQQRGFPS